MRQFPRRAIERPSVGTPSFGHQSAPGRAAPGPAWVARYDDADHFGDYGRALAVDAGGNVYVTGVSDGGMTRNDFATVKYGPGGSQLWVARYNGPANGDDEPTGIAVDGQGDVLVTGFSDGGITGRDYATVKYAPGGTETWVARYAGPGSMDDTPDAIAVDAEGDAVVAGRSGNAYASVRYAPEGTQLWVNLFTPSTEFKRSSDGLSLRGQVVSRPISLAVDVAGDAYVGGTATLYNTQGGTPTVSEDYVIIKYRGDGSQAWIATYDGPEHKPAFLAFDDFAGPIDDEASALVVDASGAVYVTGTSDANFRTAKFDSNGQQLWVAAYDGPSDSTDDARSIGIAPDGSVYVTGLSCCAKGVFSAVLKYSPQGRLVWARRIDTDDDDVPKAMAVGPDGSVIVASDAGTQIFPVVEEYSDYLVTKIASDGTWEWSAAYDGPAGLTDSTADVVVGVGGAVYVTGVSVSALGPDFATIAYRGAGP